MKHRTKVIVILAAFAALRILYIIWGPFGVSPDEAHYWEWSRRLGLSYYSKGPGIAYVIAFFTGIFGPNVLGIRIGAVVFSTLASYTIYLLGKELFESEKAGLYAAILPNITPIFSIGSILMTTDVLFLFFWASTVYCAGRALEGGKGWWYLAGVFSGLGFLSKYTMALIYPSILLFLLFSRKDRHWLARPQPYAAGALSAVISSPVIFWNIGNGQVTIKHTMGQAHVGSGAFSIAPFFEFLGSQAGLITPLIFIALVYGVWKCGAVGFREKRSGLLLAFFASAPLFLFFLFKSLHGKVQANWAIAAFITAFPASCWAMLSAYEGYGERGKRLLKAAVIFGVSIGAAASLLSYFPWVLEPLGAKRIMWGPPYNRVTGWRELGQKVSEVKEGMEKERGTFIISDTYQITSELALYTRGNPVAYNVDTGSRRMNQYDLWPGFEGLTGYNALYVKGGVADVEQVVREAFDRCDREIFTVYRNGSPLKEFSLFRCYDFRGIKHPEIKNY